jgi:hypothetical protein
VVTSPQGGFRRNSFSGGLPREIRFFRPDGA